AQEIVERLVAEVRALDRVGDLVVGAVEERGDEDERRRDDRRERREERDRRDQRAAEAAARHAGGVPRDRRRGYWSPSANAPQYAPHRPTSMPNAGAPSRCAVVAPSGGATG